MPKRRKFKSKSVFYILAIVLFLITKLVSLTKLPVFADEAIYIRWSQLAVNEPDKYLFLPMLDGKPPLHAWLMIPFLEFVADPLLAGRIVSVIAGLMTLIALDKVIQILGGEWKERLTGYLLVLMMPYWHFHHRMALAESLLALFLSVSILTGLRFLRNGKWSNWLGFSLSVGAFLWTKTNTVFFIPMLALLPLIIGGEKKSNSSFSHIVKAYSNKRAYWLAWSGFVGGLIFLTLKLSPLFPQLFSRSLDYTFSFSELVSGEWKHVLFRSLPRLIEWLVRYISPLLLIVGFTKKRKVKVLVLMAFVFALPLWVVGKVITPRHFFPVVVPLTLAIVLTLKEKGKIWGTKVETGLLVLLVGYGLWFMYPSIVNPGNIPFTKTDEIQYLTEWSAGYGIPEVRDLIKDKIIDNRVIVKTEGTFGTLPDGLLMYFDRSPHIENLSLSGIEKARYLETLNELAIGSAERESYMVVNEHRLNIKVLPQYVETVAKYPRPKGGPALLLLKINPVK